MTDFKSHFKKPISHAVAVLISDVHYNLQTLPLADAAMRQAIDKANSLSVPLIVAGDLHDSKANMRAECVNAMQETFSLAKVQPIVLRGNHDSVNEKSKEHALNHLAGLVHIIEDGVTGPCKDLNNIYLIPYQHSAGELKFLLEHVPPKSTIIMHQGITGSNSGEYIQDKSAITKDDVIGYRVISGHYHIRQTIDLPDRGQWDYIGNPYTLNYGEAKDPEKGFQILMDDGSLEFVPTNLRKHVILELEATKESTRGFQAHPVNKNDLVWVKVRGTKEQLLATPPTKSSLCYMLGIDNLKLDLIPTDTETQAPANKQELTQAELLDSMIDSLTNTSDDIKSRLKSKWKDLK